MADPTPTTVMTTAQLWTILIPVIATSIVLPMWNMWLASQNAKNAAKVAEANKNAIAMVAEKQEVTHAKQEETTAKVDAIHQITNSLLESQAKKDNQ